MVISGFTGGLAGGAVVNIVIRAIDDFSKPMANAERSVANLEKATKGLRIAGAAVAVGMVASIKQAIEFESAFTGVRKTVDLTEQGFEDLQDRFETLSAKIPVSFVELSKIGELAGQLGVEGVDNLEKFTRTIADISRTTNLTSEAAATDFARIANIVKEPIENIDRMGSVTVELGNNLATTEQEITNFALRIAAAGNISGMATSDILAIGAAFSSVGVQAERGGTAVNKVLINMTESIVEGGEKLELFSKTAGLTTLEFKELFEKDAAGAFELFVKGLGTAGDDAFGILENLGLADQRLIQSFLALAGAGDLISDAFKRANTEWGVNTALTIEAEKRYDTLESKLMTLGNQVKLLGKEFGEELAPIILDDVIPTIKKLLDQFKESSDETKSLVVDLGLITVASAGLSFFSKKLALRFFLWAAGITLVDSLLNKLSTNIPGVFVGAMQLATTSIIGLMNTVLEAIDFTINKALDGIRALADIANVIPGVNIDIGKFTVGRVFTPKIDFSPKSIEEAFKAPITTQFKPGMGALEMGGQVINITIDNIYGQDPEEVSRALKEELSAKINI